MEQRNLLFLLTSAITTEEGLHVSQDLLDILIANKDDCIGMAANMIGVKSALLHFDESERVPTIL